jgi:hypothetical protein
MKTYTLTNKQGELLTFDLPENWNEVTVNQYRGLLNLNGSEYPEIHTIANLSNTPIEFWKSYGNYPFFLELLESVSYINKAPDFLSKPSKTFVCEGQTYKMPDEPFYGNIAQYEDMKMIAIKVQDIYKNSKDDKDNEANKSISLKQNLELVECYSLIARTFLYPIITNKPYDFKEVAAYREDYDNSMSIEYTVQIASFFLKKLNVLKLGTKTKSMILRAIDSLKKMVIWKGQDTMN